MKMGIMAVCIIGALSISAGYKFKDDDYIRDRVVKIHTKNGSCSGVIIEVPSKKEYILTAAHCIAVLESGSALVTNEAGETKASSMIIEDPKSDLMIMSNPFDITDGIELAESVIVHQKVKTLTHGAGKPTYRTNGEALVEELVTIPIGYAYTPQQKKDCIRMPKNKVFELIFMKMCAMSTMNLATTASIVPGSSGGPMLNMSGELIGIVSASDGYFSYMVRLSDIKEFIKSL